MHFEGPSLPIPQSQSAHSHAPRCRALRRRSARVVAFAATAALAALSGCAVANNAIRTDFPDFNKILQSGQTHQMILNLVRLRHRESPMLLRASTLTASYESTVRAAPYAAASIDDNGGLGVGFDYGFSSKPTVTYTPVEGKDYVQQFMTEVSPETFALLLRAGWPITKLGDLLIERVTLPSGEILVGRPDAASYPKFQEFLGRLQDAEDAFTLRVETVAGGGSRLVAGAESHPMENLQLRSLFAAMWRASKGVEVPAEHADGTDGSTGFAELTIHVSDARPQERGLRMTDIVEYEGRFYSVARDDRRSRDTIALLMELSRIQAGPLGPAPIVTIPAR
jgi:hypothetical protein